MTRKKSQDQSDASKSGRRSKPWWDLASAIAALVSALVAVLTTATARFAADRTGELTAVFKSLGPDLQLLLVAVPTASAGLLTVFYLAFKWYKKQAEHKRQAIAELTEKERAIFAMVDEDLGDLLEEVV